MNEAPPGWWRLRVKDDSGVYRLLDPRQWRGSDAGRDRTNAKVIRSARVVLRAAWSLAFLVWFFGLGYTVGLFIDKETSSMSDAAFLESVPIVGIGTVVVALMGPPLIRRLLAPGAVAIMKRGSLCPTCAYSLKGLTASGGAPVTCPECGAKWRMDGGPTL